MLRSFFALRKNREGATAIEFALVAPLLFLFMFGTIEFGLIMFASSVVEGGTSNAARIAKTGAEKSNASNDADRSREDMERIRALILQRGAGVLDDEKLQIIVTPQSVETGSTGNQNTMGSAGEMVTYTTTYRWNIITPIMRQFLGDELGQIALQSVTVVYNEPFDEP